MDSISFLKPRPRAEKVREATVGGIFYPASGTELSAAVERLTTDCGAAEGSAWAILSPHGSLEYSGLVEAAAWKAASARSPRTIVLLSPTHRSYDKGIFLPESTVFAVPTAEFKVDRGLAKDLRHHTTGIVVDDIPHLEEHSIEVQLLMAARFFPQASILPIIVSDCGAERLDALFSGLAKTLGRNAASSLLVLSSNLAVAQTREACQAASSAFLAALQGGDLSAYPLPSLDRRSFCGMSMLAAFLRSSLAEGLKASVLAVSDSAPYGEEGDPVVGYGAVGFYR